MARWPYMYTLWFGDKSKVTWMIRVVGTVMVPEETGGQPEEVGEYTLSHDDGTHTASFWTGQKSYLVRFSPPSKPFVIEQVMIRGRVEAGSAADYENWGFTVIVRDKNTGDALWMQIFPWRLFERRAKWIELDVPNIAVDDDFYVEVTTGSTSHSRIMVNFDSSTPNQHSYMSRDGKVIPWEPWTWKEVEYTHEKVNWMIRVVGRAIAPEE